MQGNANPHVGEVDLKRCAPREKRLAYEKLEAGARNHILEALGHNAIGYLHDGDGAAYIRETREDGSLKRFYHKRGIKRG